MLMIARRRDRFHIIVGLVLALVILGSALHLHPIEDCDHDTPCVICHFLAVWLPAILIAVTIIYSRQLAFVTISSSVFEPQPVPFIRPPLRAPPFCCV